MKTPKFLNFVRNKLRDLYLIRVVKTNEMVYGTKFLRNSYQNIVRIELINSVEQIDPKLITIIYGDKDEMVKPQYVISNIKPEYKKCIHLIKNGKHDIGNTHVNEILNVVNNVTK